MELPAELFIRPVADHPDLIAFEYGFDVKSLTDGDTTLTEMEDGDLIIEGMAADFSGIDRDGENFAPGAFAKGIKSFIDGQAPLCWHHQKDKVLGRVLELEEIEGKGLRMKARVDGAVRTHPELGTIYSQIKRGTINALSVGGFFRRKLTENGLRITDMDFVEVSATATPVHPGTHFSVVAGKALDSEPVVIADPEVKDEATSDEDVIAQLNRAVEHYNEMLNAISDANNKRKGGLAAS